ncbi:MAG: hypothetical protein Fur0020_01050 [Thermodesulfovibrionia bacterium]
MRPYIDNHLIEKRYSITTGKLHIPCPFRSQTGINTHVVIKDGFCYRSNRCMIISCKYNKLQTDIISLLSLVW